MNSGYRNKAIDIAENGEQIEVGPTPHGFYTVYRHQGAYWDISWRDGEPTSLRDITKDIHPPTTDYFTQ